MILGIDTSCYTTSVALIDQGRLIKDVRRLLPVEEGKCGLRQSEGLFSHVKQMPQIIEEACAGLPSGCITAVAASVKPRPVEGSYMPVFRAGELTARSAAAVLGVPFYALSHQEGHIAAGCWSLGVDWQKPFIAVHLSGGTGEFLRVIPQLGSYEIELIASCDLAPGQFVDRVGVALGLPFPAGPYLEKLAMTAVIREQKFKVAVKGAEISFSGPESAARRAIDGGADSADVAAAVYENIGLSLAKAVKFALQQSKCQNALIMGGVAANMLIRQAFADSETVYFADARYAGDNAVGIAYLGEKIWQNMLINK